MRAGYILLDGCADRPSPDLNFTTPLQAASTPSLDALARSSRMGMVVTVGRGISPESDIAVFNMLGYSFTEGYPGRGVVEVVGAGINFESGQLALRANFATTDGRLITDRRAGRDLTKEEALELEKELKAVALTDAEFEFRTTVSYRGVLVIRTDEPLNSEITNTDPAYVRVKGFGAAKQVRGKERIQSSRPLVRREDAVRAAKLVNEFSAKSMKVLASAAVNREREKLGKKPANMILLRDAGHHLPDIKPFRETFGVRGTALVEMPAEVGIARLLGMKEVRVENHKDLARKGELFAREIADETLVYAHIKGPDEFGHDGDARGKKSNIEKIDREFFSKVLHEASDSTIAVSCDHATPSTLKMHSSDPVPLLITTRGRDTDCCRFTERDARKGSLGTIAGRDVVRQVLSSR